MRLIAPFLFSAVGCPEPETASCAFTDVKAGKYYSNAVSWAVKNGIAEGTTETTFSPNAKSPRSKVVTFLYKYFVK